MLVIWPFCMKAPDHKSGSRSCNLVIVNVNAQCRVGKWWDRTVEGGVVSQARDHGLGYPRREEWVALGQDLGRQGHESGCDLKDLLASEFEGLRSQKV